MPTLHWLDKEKHITAHKTVPYRVLYPNADMSYGDESQNMLIQGDNLHALKALLPYYAGKVKCIYIDPPYNTGNMFEHYDDNLENSIWLGEMYPRLVLLRELLAEDGVICCQIDGLQQAYLKVIMDEVFGRNNFIATFIWRKKAGGGQDTKYIAEEHEYIMCYQKRDFNFNFDTENVTEKDYNKTLHGRKCKFIKLEKWGANSYREDRPTLFYPIKNPYGEDYFPKAPNGRDGRWRVKPEKLSNMHITWILRGDIYVPYEVKYYDEEKDKIKIIKERSIMYDLATTTDATKEIVFLFGEKVFDTPKPEKLIQRIIHLATHKGDLVLDSFLGSGTTCAVAHKMGRRYIGIEMGEHAKTHCVPRLQKVIDGEQGGISKNVNWNGGGGYTFYQLGDTVFTENGHINPQIKFDTLARHIWFYETKTALAVVPKNEILGVHNNTAYILLYNGILGDKKPNGGNVLTRKVCADIQKKLNGFTGNILVYGESCRLSPKTLTQNNITFKQTPYDVKV